MEFGLSTNVAEDPAWDIAAPQFHDFMAEEADLAFVDNSDGFFGEQRRSSAYELKRSPKERRSPGSSSQEEVRETTIIDHSVDDGPFKNKLFSSPSTSLKDKNQSPTEDLTPRRRPLADMNLNSLLTQDEASPNEVRPLGVPPAACDLPLGPQSGGREQQTKERSEARNYSLERGRRLTRDTAGSSLRTARRSASPSSRLLQPTQAFAAKASVRSRSHSPSGRSSQQAAHKLTIPHSPVLRTSSREVIRDFQPKLSTTSRELLEIKSHLEKVKQERKRADALRQQAQLGIRGLSTVARSTKPLTLPHEPILRTTMRSKHCESSVPAPKTHAPLPVEKLIGRSTRTEPLPAATNPVLTNPKPFTLVSDLRARQRTMVNHNRIANESREPVTPLAEKVMKFQNKTPQRFHTKPKTNPSITPPQPFVPKLTEPESPNLHKPMPRPKHFLSKEEEEERLMAEIKPFKARPVSHKVLHSAGDLGVPKVEKPKPTEAQPFNFKTEQRAKLHPTLLEAEILEAEIQEVNPAPPSHQNHTNGPRGITVPQSPALQTKMRSSVRPPLVHEDAVASSQFRARPAPKIQPPRPPQSSYSKELVIPESPQLQSLQRHKLYKQRFDEKVAMDMKLEQDQRCFKAQPMRIVEPMVPKPSERELTEVEPFNIISEKRHQMAKAKLDAQIQAELEKQRQDAVPKARPMLDVAKVFVPRKSTKPLTEVQPIVLASDLQSEHRQEFEEAKEKRRREAEEARRREQEAKQRAEEEEIQRLRREELVFRAQPIRWETQASLPRPEPRELTIPESPALITKQRSIMRGGYSEAA